mmetsp:Transcript_47409/g.125188  ORF Transcript_47409/g.125188 Transcript_47409/m.125188 type:complete len:158 (+) Transcript_47409:151-624(+)
MCAISGVRKCAYAPSSPCDGPAAQWHEQRGSTSLHLAVVGPPPPPPPIGGLFVPQIVIQAESGAPDETVPSHTLPRHLPKTHPSGQDAPIRDGVALWNHLIPFDAGVGGGTLDCPPGFRVELFVSREVDFAQVGHLNKCLSELAASFRAHFVAGKTE